MTAALLHKLHTVRHVCCSSTSRCVVTYCLLICALATLSCLLRAARMEGFRGRIGVISDIQFVDQEDGFDFTGVQRRRYRNSLAILGRAVDHWNSQGDLLLLAQLGDLVDVKNTQEDGGTERSEDAVTAVKRVLDDCVCKDVVNIVGNHDLYNFRREKLEEVLDVTRGQGKTWHSFSPLAGVRIVVLDSLHVSTIQGCSKEDTKAGGDFLSKNNNNFRTNGSDLLAGLEGLDRRFVPWNGMVGKEQLAWLERTLSEATTAQEKVVVMCHIPVHPDTCQNQHLLWNYDEVLDVMDSQPGTVVAVFAGHDHVGGAVLRNGTWHVTLPSPMVEPGSGDCWGSLELWTDRLEWRGRGRAVPQHIVMPFTEINKP